MPEYVKLVDEAYRKETWLVEFYKQNPEKLLEIGIEPRLPYKIVPLSSIAWPTGDARGNGCFEVYGALILGLDKDTLEVKCLKHIVATCRAKRNIMSRKPLSLVLDVKFEDTIIDDCKCGKPFIGDCYKAIDTYMYDMLNQARKTLITLLSLGVNPCLLEQIRSKPYDEARQFVQSKCRELYGGVNERLYKHCLESIDLLYFLLTKKLNENVDDGGCP